MDRLPRRVLIRWSVVAVVLVSLAAFGLNGSPGGSGGSGEVHNLPIEARLTDRDPKASPNARAVYDWLVGQENRARRGKGAKTVIGQHIEGQNELYNPLYGDGRGTRQVGYYYKKAAQLTGRYPGFVEGDMGPGYDEPEWGTGPSRWYTEGRWPACAGHWQYTDDVNDLLFSVWKGYPRAEDSSYANDSGEPRCGPSSQDVLQDPKRDAGTTPSYPAPGGPALFDNGGRPAGLVGMSFHQPYPGAPVKGYRSTHCVNSPQRTDPEWFSRVVDYRANGPEYRALLHDLKFLGDQLAYYAAFDVPVLLRPYHEMNASGCHYFWWSGRSPEQYRMLWRIMYNYLVSTRGLRNLIFVWAPMAWTAKYSVDPEKYYPGREFVDIAAVDNYAEEPDDDSTEEPYSKRWYDGLARYAKPRMLAESFHVPITAARKEKIGDGRRPGVDALRRSPWVIWSVWGDALTERNSRADVRETYRRSNRVLTGGKPQKRTDMDWSDLHSHNPRPDG
jgi:mannan endo-1,4-beta-mannosidase